MVKEKTLKKEAIEEPKDSKQEEPETPKDLKYDEQVAELTKKRAELEDMEGRVTKKMAELKEQTEKWEAVESHGRAFAGKAVELTEEELAVKAANDYLKGTGLKIFAEEKTKS